jgi:UDP:flavonoid glycosyltransferase YjiC (YdhE family)
MSHFGILSFPGTGHLHPLAALGRELVRRGHIVTIFQVADTHSSFPPCRLQASEGEAGWRGECAVGESRLGLMQSSILALINTQRRRWGLQPKTSLNACDSELAQITQVPADFDFPHRKRPSCFHYTGPFLDGAGRRETSFPWSLLDSSRPLVFVSMGTLQNGIGSCRPAGTCGERHLSPGPQRVYERHTS